MTQEPAPRPHDGESPEQFILRLARYLAEPDRRRLGQEALGHVEAAIAAMDAPSPAALMSALSTAATQPIEDMVDIDDLRAALDTADNLADRLRDRLREFKAWYE